MYIYEIFVFMDAIFHFIRMIMQNSVHPMCISFQAYELIFDLLI